MTMARRQTIDRLHARVAVLGHNQLQTVLHASDVVLVKCRHVVFALLVQTQLFQTPRRPLAFNVAPTKKALMGCACVDLIFIMPRASSFTALAVILDSN
jgi:hypothetical protein